LYTTSDLIKKLANLQSSGDQYFQKGLFPSYRFHHHLPYLRKDNNIFFTASIIFILQNLLHHLSSGDRKIVSGIIEKGVGCYPFYQNKNGLMTYNFWQNHPIKHFPNGYFMSKLKHFVIPDDIDDTALIYLTNNPTKEDLHWLKLKLSQHANLSDRMNLSCPVKYRHLKVYSTFFGKNMPIQFDFCALCNLMYLAFKYDLQINKHDEDTLFFLNQVLQSNDHLNQPFHVAPNYGKSTLILYHAARLCESFDHPALQTMRRKILIDLPHMAGLVKNNSEDQLLVAIAQLKMGQKPLPIQQPEIENVPVPYFFAGMLNAYEGWLARKLAPNSWFHLYYHCRAYYWCLMLEYEVLRQQKLPSGIS